MKSVAIIVGLLETTVLWGGQLQAQSTRSGATAAEGGGTGVEGIDRASRVSRQTGAGRGVPRVLLVVARRRQLDGLRQALASQLASTGAQLSVERVDRLPNTTGARFARVLAARTDPSLVLVAWCEQMGDGADVLDVVDARHGRILLRTVKDCAGTEGAEEAALIVRTAVDVLLSGGSVGVALPKGAAGRATVRTARAARPQPGMRGGSKRPGVSAANSNRPGGDEESLAWDREGHLGPVRLAGEIAFRLDSLASALPADPGGGVGFLVRVYRALFWTIDIWMSSPAHRNLPQVSFSLWRYALESGVSYRWTKGRWRFDIGGSLTGEVRRFEMQAASGVVLGKLAHVDGLVAAAAKFRVSVSLTESLALFLFGGFEVTVWGASEYVVGLPGGGKIVAFDWWPVRPVSGLGLEVRLQ